MNRENLEQYGEVEEFEVTDERVVIKIGKGFTDNAMKTISFLKELGDAFPDYDVIDKCITDNDLCEYIIKKKNGTSSEKSE